MCFIIKFNKIVKILENVKIPTGFLICFSKKCAEALTNAFKVSDSDCHFSQTSKTSINGGSGKTANEIDRK